jgi:aryl-alcohol dehydrogenase-like predicted oxidoreductase
LEDAKRKGRVRAVGISTNNLADIQYLRSLGCLDVVQFASNLLDPAEPIRAFLAEHHVGGVVRGAFAAGKLSGKYFDAPPKLAADDIRGNWFDPSKIAQEFSRVAAFRQMITPRRSMVQLALRFLLDQPTTHTVVLGAKSFEEYQDAARATELPALLRDELQRVEQIRAALVAIR